MASERKADREKPVLVFVTSEFPGVSHTFVTQQIAGAMRDWDVHVVARMAGGEAGWKLARELGLDESRFTCANFYTASCWPLSPGCWSAAVSQCLETPEFGRLLALRRRTFFNRLLQHPVVRRASLIHAEWVQQALEVGLPLGRALGVPVTVSANDCSCESVAGRPLERLGRDAAGIVTLSDWSLERWRRKLGNDPRIQRVYLGVDLRRYPADAPERNNAIPTIITVGRCSEQKRHSDLIDAAARLKERGCRFRVQIVGDGPLKEGLQRRVGELDLTDRVELLGAVANTEVIPLLRQADVFVLTSEWESFGLVTAEAMASFLPVVVSRGGASPELVEEGVTGATFPVGDVPALSAALEGLIESDKLRREMGVSGRERVEREFSLDAHLRGMNAVWQNALQAGRPASGEWGPLPTAASSCRAEVLS